MAQTKTKGREQRRQSKTAKARTPNLAHFYRYKLPPIRPGDFLFELTLLRARRPSLKLDTMLESFTWDESASELTGNLQLHRERPGQPASLPIARGQQVRCRVRWAGAWYVLWTMRTKAPEVQLDTNTVSVDLADDMNPLRRAKRDWSFRKTKRRPHGYFAHEVARIACRRAGLRARAVARGRFRVPGFTMKGRSALEPIKHAYAYERSKTGTQFVIRIRDGELEVVPLRRNAMVYVLGGEIISALLSQEPASETPATVLTGRGRVGSGHKARKVSYTDYDRKVVQQLGYSHREHDYGRVDSHSDLRSKVQRDLAKQLKVTRNAQVTASGIPFIRRGDGAELALPGEGYKGKNAFVFATTAAHTVQGSSYQSTWDFTSTDPFIALREEAAAAQRKRKREERKRTKTKAAGKA